MNVGRGRIAQLLVVGRTKVLSYFRPYYHAPSLSRHWKQYTRDGVIAALVIVGLVAVFRANSATYSFAQTSWSGGVTSNNANHGTNRTGWTQYATSTGLSVNTTVQLIRTDYTLTDASTVSTIPVASTTGGGFGNGTNLQTVLSSGSISLGKTGAATPAIVGGGSFSLMLKSDGTVWAWGDGGNGKLGNNSTLENHVPVQVSNLTGIIAVAAGSNNGYALKSDGTVWAWGYGGFGALGNNTTSNAQVPVQVSITGAIAIAAFNNSAYALKSDGTVWAWGMNTNGQLGNNSTAQSNVPVQVSGITGAIAIGAASADGYAVTSDGTVWAWGLGSNGQLGNNATTETHVPVQVSNLTGVTAVTGGNNSGYALKSDGTVWAWGTNGSNELGNNSTSQSAVPVQVSGLTGVTAIAGGASSGYALKSDGTVWAWGSGSGGALGNNTTSNAPVPIQITSLSNVSVIGAGHGSAYAIYTDGTVWSWGTNNNGMLGNNSKTQSLVPIQPYSAQPTGAFLAMTTATSSVVGAQGDGYIIKPDGTVWSWGGNGNGQLGNNSTTDSYTPIQSNFTSISAVAGGSASSYALKSDGTVWASGSNGNGQLGNNSTTQSTVPVQVSNLTGVTAIAANTLSGYALKSDGTVWAWGSNTYGQLGNGTTTESHVPVQVTGLTGITAIAANQYSGYALKSDGTVWSWGYNAYGQLGNNSTTQSNVPVQVSGLSGVIAITGGTGGRSGYALKSDGTVWAWGYNASGQLGNNSYTESDVPVQVSGLTGIVSLAANSAGAYALKSDGTEWAWGVNSTGQLGANDHVNNAISVPEQTNISNVAVIGGGYNVGYAVKTDGTVWSWGGGSGGTLGNNQAINSSWVPVEIFQYQASDRLNAGTNAYYTSGTFTSATINLGSGASFGNLSFASTLNGQTIAVKVRSSATADFSGASAWTSCSNINSGSALSTGGCVTNGHQYIQYQATLSTVDSLVAPKLNSVTIRFTQYTPNGNLTSSAYDSSSSGNILASIKWTATTPTGTAVKFQLRTAPDASGTPGTWTGWMGPDGTANTYFTASDGSDAVPAVMKDGSGDEWFQYQAFLTTTGANTPTLSDVTVTYVVNAPPEFDTSFGTQGAIATQIATSTDPNWGKVEIDYKIRDPDSTTGSVTPGYITPSFEYDIGGGWVSIPAGSLSTNATANKSVSEGSYTLYTAYVDVASLIPNTYTTNARIRVTANDNEGANNIAYAITPTFTIDTKAPSISSMHIDGTSATGTVSFAGTDDTTILNYVLSNKSDYSADGLNSTSGIAQSVGNSSATIATAWNLSASSTKSVYLKVTDTYGNSATRSATIPPTPSNIEYKDISSIDTNVYREFIAWNLYPDPAPAGAPFGSYEVYRSEDGNTYSVIYTSTNPTINYYLDTSVSTTTTYFYKVAFTTANGDRTPFSRVVSDMPDAKGGTNNGALPLISNVQVTDVKNTSAKVTWTTDDLALSEVDYGTTASYGQVSTSRSYVTDHTVYLTGLTPNTSYHFRVRSIDAYSAAATDDNGSASYTFTTGGGTVISSVTTSSITDKSADIVWNTSSLADGHVSYSTDPTLLTYTDAGSDALSDSHKVTLSGLTTDTLYFYKVTSKDGDGNTTVDDNNGSFYSFRTTHDTKPPVISNVAVPVKASDGAVITWQTDKLATSQVEYGTSPKASTTSYLYSTAEVTTPTIFHSVTLSQETTRLGGNTNQLQKKTTYYFRVKSTDQAGNYAYSDESSFTTTEDGAVNILGGGYSNDTNSQIAVKPEISDVKISDVSPFGATVSFTTNTNTRALVQYGPDTDYAFSVGDAVLSQTHKVVLKGLQMNMTYHLQATAVDKIGQVATAPDQTFKTTNLAEDLGKLSTLSDNLDSLQSKLENIIESALPSINPPFIEKPTVEDIGEDFARITWRTNVKAYGSVNYAEDDSFAKDDQYTGEQANTNDKLIDHSINLSNLKPNTKYHFKVKSYVFSGADGLSSDMTFVTKAGQVQAQVRDRKKDSMHIVWSTSIPTTSVVTYKVRGSQLANRKMDDSMTTSHDILLDNLKPATTYEIRAYGLTAEGNTVEAKDTIIASTNEDIAPPAITNFKVDSALVPGRTDRTQTIVSWKTDEPATSVVYYDEGAGSSGDKLSQVKNDGLTYTDTHVVILTNLKPGTIYRFQIVSADDAGNTTKLPIRTIVTPSQSESVVDIIFKNFDDTFKFMRTVR